MIILPLDKVKRVKLLYDCPDHLMFCILRNPWKQNSSSRSARSRLRVTPLSKTSVPGEMLVFNHFFITIGVYDLLCVAVDLISFVITFFVLMKNFSQSM